MNTFENFFAAALSNGTICSGVANDRDLQRWFGDRSNIRKEEIAVRQAYDYAIEALQRFQYLRGRER